jgi:putative addiction module killer protein
LVRQPRRASGGEGNHRKAAPGTREHVEREVVCGIGEYIIDWGPGYRIYPAKDGESLIVLFGGGTERRQHSDIDRAKVLHAEYKARKMPPPVVGNVKKGKR